MATREAWGIVVGRCDQMYLIVELYEIFRIHKKYLKTKKTLSQVRWHKPVILSLRRQRPENCHKFKADLGLIVGLCLQIQ